MKGVRLGPEILRRMIGSKNTVLILLALTWFLRKNVEENFLALLGLLVFRHLREMLFTVATFYKGFSEAFFHIGLIASGIVIVVLEF